MISNLLSIIWTFLDWLQTIIPSLHYLDPFGLTSNDLYLLSMIWSRVSSFASPFPPSSSVSLSPSDWWWSSSLSWLLMKMMMMKDERLNSFAPYDVLSQRSKKLCIVNLMMYYQSLGISPMLKRWKYSYMDATSVEYDLQHLYLASMYFFISENHPLFKIHIWRLLSSAFPNKTFFLQLWRPDGVPFLDQDTHSHVNLGATSFEAHI